MAILSENETFRDTYEVERFLGEGAFAEVYRVRHRFLGKQAMKVFKASGMTLADIEQAMGEAIMLSRIGHPNIVRVFDANLLETPKGTYGYFTMENVPGGSLEKFWASHGEDRMPVATAVDIIRQICRGISVAHGESPPIIHRDIKPQNILIGYENGGLRVRVSDFGLAKEVNALTLLATAAGTLAFKPPEAFMENRSDSCASDVWAIGVTFYQLLTDRLPHPPPDILEWGNRYVFLDTIIPPSQYNADVDERLDRILRKALRLKPEDRYQNATEMLASLDKWIPGEPGILQLADSSPSPVEIPQQPQNTEHETIHHAMELKKQGQLTAAAQTMEDAFLKWPHLREKYDSKVRLWRCGIAM